MNDAHEAARAFQDQDQDQDQDQENKKPVFNFPKKGAADISISGKKERGALVVQVKPPFSRRGKDQVDRATHKRRAQRGVCLPQLSQHMRTLGAKKYEFIGQTLGTRVQDLPAENSTAKFGAKPVRPQTAMSTRSSQSSKKRPTSASASVSYGAGAKILIHPKTLNPRNAEEIAMEIMKVANIHQQRGTEASLTKSEIDRLKYSPYDDFARYMSNGFPSLFDDYDTNGNGMIEMKELKHAVAGWIRGDGDISLGKKVLKERQATGYVGKNVPVQGVDVGSQQGKAEVKDLFNDPKQFRKQDWSKSRKHRGDIDTLHKIVAPRPCSREYMTLFRKKHRGEVEAFPHLNDMGGGRREQSNATLIVHTGDATFNLRPMNQVSSKTQLRGKLKLDRETVLRGTSLFNHLCKMGQADMNIFDQVMQHCGSRDTYINDRLFCTFDTDKSGFIDCNEFTLGLTSMWDTSLGEKIGAYFEALDTDKDGFLDIHEVKRLLVASKLYPTSKAVNTAAFQIFKVVLLTSWKQTLLVL